MLVFVSVITFYTNKTVGARMCTLHVLVLDIRLELGLEAKSSKLEDFENTLIEHTSKTFRLYVSRRFHISVIRILLKEL